MDDLMVVLGSFFMMFAVIFIALYLLDAIATFKYLKVRGYENAWMAFIPIVNTYASVDATYGNVDTIKVLGIQLPAIVVKLYPLIFSVLSGVCSRIPTVGSALATIISVATIVLAVVVFIDMMERINTEVTVGFAVLANIIAIIAPIKILMSCSGLQPGQFDYKTDMRVLKSQMNAAQ